jgi:hypothetical protein
MRVNLAIKLSFFKVKAERQNLSGETVVFSPYYLPIKAGIKTKQFEYGSMHLYETHLYNLLIYTVYQQPDW